MKNLMLFAMVSLTAVLAQASGLVDLQNTKCDENPVSLNTVYEMRSFSNSQIKVFSVDTIEPAAVPVSLAITVDRGEDLSTYESFCRRISSISSVASLSKMKSSYDPKTNILTLEIAIKQMTEDGEFVSKTLRIKVNKAAQREEDMVQADTR